MKRSITASLAVCLLMIGADAFSADVPKGEKGLQGTWSLSAGEAECPFEFQPGDLFGSEPCLRR